MHTPENVLKKDISNPKRRILLGGLLGVFANPVLRILEGKSLIPESHAESLVNRPSYPIAFSSVLDKKPDSRFSHIFGIKNIELFDNGLRISHKKGTYGPQSGSGFIYELDRSIDGAILTYDIMFKSRESNGDLDYSRGGKLPGFSGGDAPRGGADSANGFSTRLMWTKRGGIDIYLYIPGKKEIYGSHISGNRNFRFESHIYYQIQQELRLNTPGKQDGSIIVYIDGKEVAKAQNIIFRDTNNSHVKINSIMFSNFLGGHDQSWTSDTDFDTYFKNFKITILD